MASSIYPKITVPTGYESEAARLALRQKLADALLERGMTQQGTYGSPLQVLGQILQGAAGMHMENKVAKESDALSGQIRDAHDTTYNQLMADVNAGMSPQALLTKYGNNSLITEDLKPFVAAMQKGMEDKATLVDTGGASGFQPKGDFVGKPMPNDPNKAVWIDSSGNATVNPALAAAHMYANPNLVNPAQMPTTAPIPVPGAPPAGASPAGLPATPPASSAGDIDLSRLTPEERQILQAEIARRSGLSPDASSMHGDTGLTPPPSKVLGGKPYWNIGGKWYDNPEGR